MRQNLFKCLLKKASSLPLYWLILVFFISILNFSSVMFFDQTKIETSELMILGILYGAFFSALVFFVLSIVVLFLLDFRITFKSVFCRMVIPYVITSICSICATLFLQLSAIFSYLFSIAIFGLLLATSLSEEIISARTNDLFGLKR